MRTIICITGTSIAGGPLKNAGTSLEDLRQHVQNRLAELQTAAPAAPDLWNRACAESKSLLALGTDAKDAVCLVHADQDDHRACAEVLQGLLVAAGIKTEARAIAGLLVSDPRQFRTLGVRNLYGALDSVCCAATGPVILNAAGTARSTLPYLTLFGMARHLPVVCIFEHSNHVVTIPPGPSACDYDDLRPLRDVVLTLRQQGTMAKAEFITRELQGLDARQRGLVDLLLEEEENQVSLSPAALLLFPDQAAQFSDVMLAPAAQAALEASSGDSRDQFTSLLYRVADPLWRACQAQSSATTDLSVFRAEGAGEVLLAYALENQVHVCELLLPGELENGLLPHRRADHQTSTFTRWQRPSSGKAAAQAATPLLERLRRQLADAKRKREEAELRLGDTEQRLKTLQAELAAAATATVQPAPVDEKAQAEFANVTLELQEAAAGRDEAVADLKKAKAALKDAESTIQEREAELTQTRKHAHALEKRVAEAEAKLRDVHSAHGDTQEAAAGLEKENVRLQDSLKETQAAALKLENRCGDAEKRLQAVEKQLADARRAVEDHDHLCRAVEQLRAENDRLKQAPAAPAATGPADGQAHELNAALEVAKLQHTQDEEKLRLLTVRLKEKEAETERLQKAHASLAGAMETTRGQLAAQQTALDAQKGRMIHLETEVQTLRRNAEEHSKAQAIIAGLRQDMEKLQASAPEHLQERQQLQTAQAQLQEANAKLQAANDELCRELAKQRVAGEDLRGELQKLQAAAPEQQQQLEQLQATLATLQEAKANLETTNSQLQESIDQREADFNALHDELGQVRDRAAGLAAQLEDLTTKLAAEQTEREQALEQIRSLEEDVAARDTELQALRDTHNQVLAELEDTHAQVQQLQAASEAVSGLVANAERDAESAKAALAEREQQFQALEADVKKLKQDNKMWRHDIDELDKELARLFHLPPWRRAFLKRT